MKIFCINLAVNLMRSQIHVKVEFKIFSNCREVFDDSSFKQFDKSRLQQRTFCINAYVVILKNCHESCWQFHKHAKGSSSYDKGFETSISILRCYQQIILSLNLQTKIKKCLNPELYEPRVFINVINKFIYLGGKNQNEIEEINILLSNSWNVLKWKRNDRI